MNAPHRLRIEHRSHFRYTEPVRGSVMLLRLHPREDGGQQVLDFGLESEPAVSPAPLPDAFGNTCHLVNIHREHDETVLDARMHVQTCPAPDPGAVQQDTWEALAAAADPVRAWEYLYPSAFVRSGEMLENFVRTHGIVRGDGPVSSLLAASSALYETFSYVPGSTGVYSPIEHILETGRGVCQDYTHVLLAIARAWGIPGRYVSGYLHLEGVAGEQVPDGASHSWGEFLLPELGWVGVDPTNNTLADRRHVRVAVGRDYADAAPTRGSLFGSGETHLEVRVTVRESDEPADAARMYPQHANLVHARAEGPAPRQAGQQQQ